MRMVRETAVALKSILYLTDFSEPSEAALPFAIAIARNYEGTVHALHILTPVIPESRATAIQTDEELAEAEMRKVESQLVGVSHETITERGVGVWPGVEQAIREHNIDLIVLGTHGRTGADKFILGSVAEEIFRRSSVPVLTIGPNVRSGAHNRAHFHRVLFPTDFGPESTAAAPYAVSLATENQARLVLVHVMRNPEQRKDNSQRLYEISVAEATHQLYEIVPNDSEFWPPEVAVEYGEPGDRIVDSAKQRGADLIVLGVRSAAGHLGAATHLERKTAHKIVAHAHCPVSTVRAEEVAVSG
jgi:nucleotide-binding universal stress UspA family protein